LGWLAGSLSGRHDAHQRGAAHEKPGQAGQSSSAERLIAAPRVQVPPHPIAVDRAVQVATATMLLEEGVEVGE
jgi:hypothetical protein